MGGGDVFYLLFQHLTVDPSFFEACGNNNSSGDFFVRNALEYFGYCSSWYHNNREINSFLNSCEIRVTRKPEEGVGFWVYREDFSREVVGNQVFNDDVSDPGRLGGGANNRNGFRIKKYT